MHPNIAFCPTKNNIDELDDVYNICKEIGVEEIRIQPLMNIGRASSNLEKIFPNKQQYIRLITNINKLKTLYHRDKIKISWGDLLEDIYRYRNMKDIFSIMVNIKANGSIDVSPYLPINVGNVKRHSIIEYWNAGLYNCWGIKEVQDISKNLYCVSKMDKIECYGKRG